ncbi:porin [Chitinimonas viridis]|uniref:Porin n=1 Tax=Chitinimonas viridis TaxID=664880 RepID=A0ABT8B323_9NEIS|nr:porin [Chitinimonas viridis]MDN3576095.1 porin [Chitinimonas viridis]
MRKALLATLVMGALAAPAFAEGTVTVYGQMNVGVVFHDEGPVTKTKVDNLYTSSRLGFKGDENLGDGLKAFWQIEQGLRPDDAATTNFASREGWVGLQGDFGKVGLGRGKTPYTNMVDWFDIFDGAIGAAATASYSVDSIQDSRFSNAVRYDSPNLSGFNLSGMYSFGENKTSTTGSSDGFSGLASYSNGPIKAGLSYGQQRNLAGVSGNKKSAWQIGGIYTLGDLGLGLAYQAGEWRTAGVDYDRDTVTTTVTYKIGAGTLRAGAQFAAEADVNGKSAADSDFTRYAIGYKHGLSKRTYALVEYSALSADKSIAGAAVADQRGLAVGLMHTF